MGSGLLVGHHRAMADAEENDTFRRSPRILSRRSRLRRPEILGSPSEPRTRCPSSSRRQRVGATIDFTRTFSTCSWSCSRRPARSRPELPPLTTMSQPAHTSNSTRR